MKYIIIMFATLVAFAQSKQETFKQNAKDQFIAKVEQADKELAKARESRDKKVKDAADKYLKALEKLKVYWTKKGKLEEALKIQKEMDSMATLVAGGNTSSLVKAPENIAPAAEVTCSSSYSSQYSGELAIDRVKGLSGSGEWATKRETEGAWIKLKWDKPITVHKVVLYDRVNLTDWITDATLKVGFQSIKTGPLNNNGAAKEIVVDPPVETTWIKLTVDKANGACPGLSEIEVIGK